VAVHLVDLHLRRLHTDLLRIRADLLLGELVELLLHLPHIDDAEPVTGLGHPTPHAGQALVVEPPGHALAVSA
jgi:hypothetical protein